MVTLLSEPSPSQTAVLSDLVVRIRAEYAQMPGLKLTAPQARRLWGADGDTCDAALAALMKARFLSRTREGLFVRVGNSVPSGCCSRASLSPTASTSH